MIGQNNTKIKAVILVAGPQKGLKIYLKIILYIFKVIRNYDKNVL